MSLASILEEDYEETSVPLEICNKMETKIITKVLLKKIFDSAVKKGIRILLDNEATLYESVFSLLSTIVACSNYWLTEEEGIAEDLMGNPYKISLSLFSITQPSQNEVLVVFNRERPDSFWDELETVLMYPRLVYVVLTKGTPNIDVTTAVFLSSLIPSVLEDSFKVLHNVTKERDWIAKIKYIGRVPYDVLVYYPLDIVKEIARTWEPPPPPYSSYLKKTVRSIDELVISENLRKRINDFMILAGKEGRGSLLLVGLPASGRKTIAKAIANSLSLPAYHMSISNILSEFVGKSEEKLRAFFSGMRTRGGVAVFESVESLFRKTKNDNVTSNLRSILFQEMARDDNNFIIVFTTDVEAPNDVFDSPLIGETKLIVPPPTKSERKTLTRMFTREIAGESWSKIVEIAVNSHNLSRVEAENFIYSMWSDPISAVSVGFTSGEIYRITRKILIPTIDNTLREKRIHPIINLLETIENRDYTTRQAKLLEMIRKAVTLGETDVANTLLEVTNEVRRKAIEVAKRMEKYRVV